jgi:hypothetical protein
MVDANECREYAKHCVRQAAQTADPIIKERLTETAQGWTRLASDLEDVEQRLAKLAHANNQRG